MQPIDTLGRPLGTIRLSVTDRCNLRCQYCMPEEDYLWIPHDLVLTFEEITRVARILLRLGVDKIRLTGGEPMLRRDLPDLVASLARLTGLRDIALTTNGLLLERFAAALAAAGLRRVTISLDTLRPDRFRTLTRSREHGAILRGLDAAARHGLPAKLNAVILRDFNDDELVDLLEFGRQRGVEVRFIEYMDVGGATRWSAAQVVSRREMLSRLATHYGRVEPLSDGDPSAPADRFALPDGTRFGIIASTTAPFCRTCDRARLTADGMWYLCLYAHAGLDLRAALRGGLSDDEIAAILTESWRGRDDRGAEQRLAVTQRGPLVPLQVLRTNVHAEMHTRGG